MKELIKNTNYKDKITNKELVNRVVISTFSAHNEELPKVKEY